MIPKIKDFKKTLKISYEDNYSLDAKFQHLLHVFEGYRSAVQNDPETEPYSPYSARALSFKVGQQIYENDIKGINFVDDSPIIFSE